MKKNQFITPPNTLSRKDLRQINGGGMNKRAVFCRVRFCVDDNGCRSLTGEQICYCSTSPAQCLPR